MAVSRLTLLASLAWQEWRRFRFSPIWLIGIVCGGFLAVSESDSSIVLGYPSASQALYGFQLATSVVFGFIACLMAAGSLAADLEPARKALIFSRPITKLEFLVAKFAGVFSLALAAVLPVLLISTGLPVWRGYGKLHAPGPFFTVTLWCAVPMLAYVTALALALTALFRRTLVVLPLFTLYFFSAALMHPGGPSHLSFFDFSLRLYPRELMVQAPLALREVTFASLLSPLSGTLVARSGLYLAFSVLLLALAWCALRIELDQRIAAAAERWRARFRSRWITSRGGPVGHAWPQPGSSFRDLDRTLRRTLDWDSGNSTKCEPACANQPSGSTRLGVSQSWRVRLIFIWQHLRDELTLVGYSARMLAGRNLVATGMILAGLIVIVLTYNVGHFQTREGVLLFQLEMFAPLLGIVMCSDLVATEFEGRRIDLLRVSRQGAVWVVLRRLVHATGFCIIACGCLTLVLRAVYTSFSVPRALGIMIPGVLFFGMIGLLAASATRRSLVGYAAGTGAMVVSLLVKQVEPLVATSFHHREQLANSRLFGEWNWLAAKAVFCVLAVCLAAAVLRMIARQELARRLLITAVSLVVATHVGLHLAWSEASNGPPPGDRTIILEHHETADSRVFRQVIITPRQRGSQVRDTAALVDVRQVRKGERWEVASQTPADLTRELEIPHLDLDVSVKPAAASVEGRARFDMTFLGSPSDRARFFLGTELEVRQLVLNGVAVPFSRHADLVEVTLPAKALANQPLKFELHYGGKLLVPQNLGSEGSANDFLFVTTRWYPCLRGTRPGPRPLFTCVARIQVPAGYHVAAAKLLSSEAGGNSFLWESGCRVEWVPLCVGSFRVYQRPYRDGVGLSFCTFSTKSDYAERMLSQAAGLLRRYQQAFGPYPFRNAAIVENRFQGAGGAGFSSMITIKPERLAPEHETRFAEGYLPHELAHLWFGNTMTPWIAEGSAVYANYCFLAAEKGKLAANRFLDTEFYPALSAPETTAGPLVQTAGALKYVKGGYLLKMLSESKGEAAVLAFLGAFYREGLNRHRFDPDEMSDTFIAKLKVFAGADLEGFVDDMTRTVKRFDPALISLRQNASRAAAEAQIELQHFGEMRFPVPVSVKFADGAATNLHWNGREEHGVLTVLSSQPILWAEIDSEHNLLDWNRANNRVTPSAANQSSESPRGPTLAGWKTYSVAEGLPDMDIRCLAGRPGGGIIAAAFSIQVAMKGQWAVGSVTGDRWEPYSPKAEPVLLVTTLAAATDGSLWLGSQNHLRRMRGNDRTDWWSGEIRRGGTIGSGIFVPSPQSQSGLPGSQIYSLLAARDGQLWAGTDHGLIRFSCHDGDCLPSPQPGLEGLEIFSLAEDGSGAIWAGTDKGVFKISENAATRWVRGPGDLVLSLAPSPLGGIWCGTFRSGLWHIGKQTAVQYSHANAPVPDTIFSCVACDPRGTVWAGTPDGLFTFNGRAWKRFDRDNSGLPSNRIHCLGLDPAGRLWLGTEAGLTRYTLTSPPGP